MEMHTQHTRHKRPGEESVLFTLENLGFRNLLQVEIGSESGIAGATSRCRTHPNGRPHAPRHGH